MAVRELTPSEPERSREAFVAVTVPVHVNEVGVPRIVMETGYQLGLRLTGCNVLTVSTALDREQVDQIFRVAHGLLVTGGEDVDPSRYGDENRYARDVSPERDALEADLITRSVDRGMPVLAICRGMQLLNVVMGGSLYQDLAREFEGEIAHDRYELFDRPVHDLRALEPRYLQGLLPEDPFPINSAHHQGVRELGEHLRPVAVAEDGLVEAVELASENRAWTVGVQWHPERLLRESPGVNAAIFRRFGKEVQRAARTRGTEGYLWSEKTAR